MWPDGTTNVVAGPLRQVQQFCLSHLSTELADGARHHLLHVVHTIRTGSFNRTHDGGTRDCHGLNHFIVSVRSIRVVDFLDLLQYSALTEYIKKGSCQVLSFQQGEDAMVVLRMEPLL
jgi:hypothetical protein